MSPGQEGACGCSQHRFPGQSSPWASENPTLGPKGGSPCRPPPSGGSLAPWILDERHDINCFSDPAPACPHLEAQAAGWGGAVWTPRGPS